MNEMNRQKMAPWIPLAFCAFLSAMALCMQVYYANHKVYSGNFAPWMPAFFANLPMCFFFVGSLTSGMRKEILELRRQVEELQQRSINTRE